MEGLLTLLMLLLLISSMIFINTRPKQKFERVKFQWSGYPAQWDTLRFCARKKVPGADEFLTQKLREKAEKSKMKKESEKLEEAARQQEQVELEAELRVKRIAEEKAQKEEDAFNKIIISLNNALPFYTRTKTMKTIDSMEMHLDGIVYQLLSKKD